MNKSTPLSQLPNAAQQQTSFVNDQQKQMVTNAQAAVQNINMPQNTQIPPEIINDDDATIQEVLNQINSQKGGGNNLSHMSPPPPSMQHHVEMMTQQVPPQMMDMGSMMMPAGSAYQPTYYPPQPQMIPSSAGSSIELFLQFFADDIKLATLIFAVFVGVHFLPIGSLLSRYVAIDKIPYHDLLLKGIVATVIVIVAKKMISSTKQ